MNIWSILFALNNSIQNIQLEVILWCNTYFFGTELEWKNLLFATLMHGCCARWWFLSLTTCTYTLYIPSVLCTHASSTPSCFVLGRSAFQTNHNNVRFPSHLIVCYFLVQDMLYRFFTERYVLDDIAHLGAFDFLQAVVSYSNESRVSPFFIHSKTACSHTYMEALKSRLAAWVLTACWQDHLSRDIAWPWEDVCGQLLLNVIGLFSVFLWQLVIHCLCWVEKSEASLPWLGKISQACTSTQINLK